MKRSQTLDLVILGIFISVGVLSITMVSRMDRTRDLTSRNEVTTATAEAGDQATQRAPASSSAKVESKDLGLTEDLKPAPAPLLYFEKEVRAYAKLVRKIFPTASDLAEKQRLLASQALIKAMGERLLMAASNPMGVEEQDLAIDFLFEALRTDEGAPAVEALEAVITDKQVEDEALNAGARENLAGVKGEVLYRWSAIAPGKSEALEKALPGPVSVKLWQNVVEAQSMNLAESQAEIDAGAE
jgi:hypothetical protein